MVVNRIMKDVKKSLAYQILYLAVKKIQQKTETNPLLVLRQAIRRVTPNIGVKTRRNKKGSTRKVPIEIGSKQGRALAIRWLLEASQKQTLFKNSKPHVNSQAWLLQKNSPSATMNLNEPF